MVSIRLQRIGRKKQPYFRVVAQDKTKDPWDKSLEILGSLNPRTKEVTLNADRIKYWLSVGAQPTARLHNLFIDEKIIEGDKQKTIVITKKRAAKIAEKNAAANPVEETPAEAKEEKIEEATEEKESEVQTPSPEENGAAEEKVEETTEEEEKEEKTGEEAK
jgi:small subunit ribosomal protein S16